MRKNGFTLIELLAVIVLLVIIFIIAYPSVNKVINQGLDVTYEKQIDKILSSAYDWSLKNVSELPEKGQSIYITLGQLKSEGYIDADITNPKTKELFPDSIVINITNVGSNYKDAGELSKVSGDYLYTVNING